MNSAIFENNSIKITNSTFTKGREVFQINQISNITPFDDEVYNKSDPNNLIVKGVIAIIVSLLLWQISIIVPILGVLIGGAMIYFGGFNKKKPKYHIEVNFLNGQQVTLTGEKEVINEINNAFVQALEN